MILDFRRKKGIGFILRNESSSAHLSSFAISIDEVEIQTGLDFFHSLEDTDGAKIESIKDPDQWIWK